MSIDSSRFDRVRMGSLFSIRFTPTWRQNSTVTNQSRAVPWAHPWAPNHSIRLLFKSEFGRWWPTVHLRASQATCPQEATNEKESFVPPWQVVPFRGDQGASKQPPPFSSTSFFVPPVHPCPCLCRINFTSNLMLFLPTLRRSGRLPCFSVSTLAWLVQLTQAPTSWTFASFCPARIFQIWFDDRCCCVSAGWDWLIFDQT